MKNKGKFIFFIFLITVLTSILRLWQLDRIPPLINSRDLPLRFISVLISICNQFLLFIYLKNKYKYNKLTLISCWVYSVIPWTIEQGRMYSQPNYLLLFFLVMLILVERFKKSYHKILFSLLFILSYRIIYPQSWIFQNFKIISPYHIITNFINLLSPSFFFFSNTSFWFGGVREFGIIYLSFLPFLFWGFITLFNKSKYDIFCWTIFIALLSVFNPSFPEGREFYLAVPFIIIMVSIGIYEMKILKIFWKSIVIILFSLIFIYDSIQFIHFFTTHYPQQIYSNLSNIHEPF